MKRTFLALGAIVLVLVSCSTTDETLAPAAPPAVERNVAVEAAPAPDAPLPATDHAAAITPELLCVDNDGWAFFAYDNDADEPVIIELGSDNELTGAVDDDEPFVTFLFAPGRVSPAFRAFGVDGAAPVWSVTSPDGETRTAGTDDAVPCTPELLSPTVPDDRVPGFEVSAPRLLADGVTVEFDVTLVGVPETSVCHPAFDPEPARIRIDDGVGGDVSEGTSGTRSGPLFEALSAKDGARTANVVIAALVVDRCTYDGVTAESWPSGLFMQLEYGYAACVVERPDGFDVEADRFGCPLIPPTGGTRGRLG